MPWIQVSNKQTEYINAENYWESRINLSARKLSTDLWTKIKYLRTNYYRQVKFGNLDNFPSSLDLKQLSISLCIFKSLGAEEFWSLPWQHLFVTQGVCTL